MDFAVRPSHTGKTRRRDGQRHFDILPDHLGRQRTPLHIHQNLLPKLNRDKIGGIGTVSGLRPRARINVVVKHLRHFEFRHTAQILNAGHFA